MKIILLTATLFYGQFLMAQSNCSNPTVISSLPFSSGDLTTCGAENDFSRGVYCAGNLYGGGEDYVFTYVADSTATWSLSLGGAGIYKVVSVNTACPPNTMNCVGGATTGAGTTVTTSITFEEGEEYFIYVDTWSPPNCVEFTLNIDHLPPVPENNECSGAVELTCETGTIEGTTLGTTEITSPGCGSKFGVWYTFTGNGFQTIINSTASGNFDHKMGIYRDSCENLVLLTCRDAAGAGLTETHSFFAETDVQYFVYIAHSSSLSAQVGNFTISRICVIPPPNNDCDGAILFADGEIGSIEGYFSNFVVNNSDPNEECDGDVNTSGGLWYKVISDRDDREGEELTITIAPSVNLEVGLYVYAGNCNELELIDCSDGAIAGESESVTLTNVNDSLSYYIMVKRERSASGEFNLTATGSALPIELMSLEANPFGKLNKITWKTATEYNNAFQIIEKSSNGVNYWSEVDRVKGTNKQFTSRYEVIDERPYPETYYRLRSVDHDGKTALSKLVFVNRKDLSDISLTSVYPIPVADELTIEFSHSQEEKIDVIIYDYTGRMIQSAKIESIKGTQKHLQNVSNLPAGTYIIKMAGHNMQEYRKFVKQ